MDEDEGQKSRHDHEEGTPRKIKTLNIDTAGVDVGMGGGVGESSRSTRTASERERESEWYGVQEDAHPVDNSNRQRAVRWPRSRTGSGAAGKGKSGKGKGGGDKSRGKSAGRGKQQVKVNPSIGKSNLDAIIAQTREEAKKGAFAEAFGGERVETAAVAGAGEKHGAVTGSSIFAGDAERAKADALEAEAARAEEVGVEVEEGEGDGVPATLAGRWKKRVTFVGRTAQIWTFLFHVLVKLLRQKLVQRDEERMSARRRKLGRYLCKAFLKLGPTFIKIGQVTYSEYIQCTVV